MSTLYIKAYYNLKKLQRHRTNFCKSCGRTDHLRISSNKCPNNFKVLNKFILIFLILQLFLFKKKSLSYILEQISSVGKKTKLIIIEI